MWRRRTAPALARYAAVVLLAGCYEVHMRPGELGAPEATPGLDRDQRGASPRLRDRTSEGPAGRPVFERPNLPPIECEVEPTPQCEASFPRVMIVMDASSSMLAGRSLGGNNWDKARFALAGNPSALDPSDPGYVRPAFDRELEVRGNWVTMEDVFHLGLVAFNERDVQRLMLQYTPCASDNIRWAMDPYVSCEPPGCSDPYQGQPSWTFKDSDRDRDPPFQETTRSYMPPCNPDSADNCVGTVYNTYTGEGLEFAFDNVEAYRGDPSGFALSRATRFANILITDGMTAPDSMPESALQRMAELGVPTYVIGLAAQGVSPGSGRALEQLDRYASLGGTQLATQIEADERDIAEAFASTVTRIIDDIGTDPCCQPYHCRDEPEPLAPR